MICSVCGSENEPGRKFCGECGSSLAHPCPNCGTVNPPGTKFCGECGTALAGGTPAARAAPVPGAGGQAIAQAPAQGGAIRPHIGTAAERRLVSVLFADLVGFTSLSEQRDAEEVRDLLTRYFDTARQVIGRYGGTVEKFIGDAVMAIWGAPVAREDDAERAVRAALELTGAIREMGADVGAENLQARAGVLTGEAAVTIGAEGQGMVAGDLVNTASRIQSVAAPGTVLVGEATRRASEATIVYEDAGLHEVKGKTEPLHLCRAMRVVAALGGARRSVGLEAPFAGRDREMRLLKELFHASAEEGKAHVVSVVGTAGVGKSRLGWEFDKYTDGLIETILWHRGRCLAYGEGVTYWALAEMVRMRARIAEGEDAASGVAKLHATVEEYVPDDEERKWIEPRLAHLLGLEDRTASDQEDLFGAWRRFFERMAERAPTVLVFEDMQWADASLLDFIEYLMEWSRSYSIFVLTLARPELLDKRPNWGAGSRNFTSLFLEPLSSEQMESMLTELVPGLTGELRAQILARSEGVPLYAVETVRMLLDRGLLEPSGSEYRPTGPIEALDVPETLQALIAARLDGLSPDERHLLQHASVAGKFFTEDAVVAISEFTREEVDAILTSLVRKEVLWIQPDRRSPEHGQYGFLQDLVKRVAYETMSRKDRKQLHLAMADHIDSARGADEEEVVEVLAAHYLAAFEAAPEAEDAVEIKGKARQMLVRAGDRAASLAASEEAQRYYERAADMADDPMDRAPLLERAGVMARAGGHTALAEDHFRKAIELFESAGEARQSARVSARLGQVEWRSGRLDAAIERMERAFEVLSGQEPDPDVALLAAQLGRLYYFRGEHELATARVEAALTAAEALWLPEVLSEGFNSKGLIALSRGRAEEALALVKHALKIAVDADISSAALRAYNNLAEIQNGRDRYQDALDSYQKGIALARKVGDRVFEQALLAESGYPLMAMGRWDEALALADEVPGLQTGSADVMGLWGALIYIHLQRGELDSVEELFTHYKSYEDSTDVQDRSLWASVQAVVQLVRGNTADAYRYGREAFDQGRQHLGLGSTTAKWGFVAGVEAAFSLGQLDHVEELLGVVEASHRGEVPAFLRAQATRFRARLATLTGDDEQADAGYRSGAALLRELSVPMSLAVVLLEHAEWLLARDRPAEGRPQAAEAESIFKRLDVAPWIERAAAAAGAREEPGVLSAS